METQMPMPMPGAVRSLSLAPMELIEVCRHRLDAIRLCVQLSSLSHEHVAKKLGMDKSHFSRIMQGKAYFPDTKTIQLMELCGNIAPTQFEMYALRLSATEPTPKRRSCDFGGRRQSSMRLSA